MKVYATFFRFNNLTKFYRIPYNTYMDIFKYDFKGAKCPECNKDLEALYNGTITCGPCKKEIWATIAERTALGHFLEGLCCIFDFQFLSAMGSFIWMIQRIFSIGDYNPNSSDPENFYVKNLIKKEK